MITVYHAFYLHFRTIFIHIRHDFDISYHILKVIFATGFDFVNVFVLVLKTWTILLKFGPGTK